MDEVKLDGKSLDITKMNIEALKELFPDVVEEGKIDFEKLRAILGDEVDDSNERYNFTWHGKNQAIRISQTPSMGTLRPCKEKSVDWDNTKNIYIEGDNLEVLKLLQKSYFGKVKMIYIDPPYNTGKNDEMLYSDDYSDNIHNYLALTGQIDGDNRLISSTSESGGRIHTNWLNMMYPRLRLSRNLLTEDGIIFISIDDHEFSNLKKICDEIFGESNYICNFVWEKGKEGGNDSSIMRSHYDNILCYCRNSSSKTIINLDKKDTSRHITEDPEPNLVDGIVSNPRLGKQFQLINLSKQKDYTVSIPLIGGEILSWPSYAPQKTIDEWIEIGKVFVGSKKVPYIKSYLEDELQGQKPSNIIGQDYGTTKAGSIEMRELFGSREVFPYPKPTSLIKRLIEIGSSEQSIVLDFFSGSGTTAHAVFRHNLDKHAHCSFILVQYPEECKPDSEAFKLGFKTICDLGEERIKIVSNQMKKGLNQTSLDSFNNLNVDLGFRVFSLFSSNIKRWSGQSSDIQKTLSLFEDNLLVDSDRSDYDILYELILKLGLPLTSKIEKLDVNLSKPIYSIGYGALMIYLDAVSSIDVAEMMIDAYHRYQPEIWKVVFRDTGFSSDSVKANIRETLKAAGLKEDCFLTL